MWVAQLYMRKAFDNCAPLWQLSANHYPEQ